MVTYGRHPFVRLVSTYKDKVIDHKSGLGLRWKIMMKFDKNQPYSVNYIWLSGAPEQATQNNKAGVL